MEEPCINDNATASITNEGRSGYDNTDDADFVVALALRRAALSTASTTTAATDEMGSALLHDEEESPSGKEDLSNDASDDYDEFIAALVIQRAMASGDDENSNQNVVASNPQDKQIEPDKKALSKQVSSIQETSPEKAKQSTTSIQRTTSSISSAGHSQFEMDDASSTTLRTIPLVEDVNSQSDETEPSNALCSTRSTAHSHDERAGTDVAPDHENAYAPMIFPAQVVDEWVDEDVETALEGPLVPAVLVDDEDEMEGNDESMPENMQRRVPLRRLTCASMLTGCVVIAAFLGFALRPSNGNWTESVQSTEPPVYNTDTKENTNVPSPTAPTMLSPTTPSSSTEHTFVPFTRNNDLINAVGEYLKDNSPNTAVAKLYGHPIGTWDVGAVTDFSHIFSAAVHEELARTFNEPVNDWDVSSGKSFWRTFYRTEAFNQPLSRWNVSQATSFSEMFQRSAFNQDISSWKPNMVEDTKLMFYLNRAFNQPIGHWDMSSVLDMEQMFGEATSFNQPLQDWDVSNVDSLHALFYKAAAFNQPLNAWNVSHVTDISSCFSMAESFNQDLSGWLVSSVGSIGLAFQGALAFAQDLCAWGHGLPVDCQVSRAFEGTACPEPNDPDLARDDKGPFCHVCAVAS